MPTLEELIQQSLQGRLNTQPQQGTPPPLDIDPAEIEKAVFGQPEQPGLWKATKEAFTSPAKTTKGATLDFVRDAGKGIISTLLNAPNALLPAGIKMPGSSDPAAPGWSQPSDVLPNINLRLARLGNALTFGLSDQIVKRISESVPKGAKNPLIGQGGTELNLEEQFGAVAKGVAKTVALDVVPLQMTTNFIRGNDIQGNPLTPETYGQTVSALALSWLPFAGMFGKRGAVAARLTHEPEITSKLRTAGEIVEARNSLTEMKKVAGEKGWLTRRTREATEELAEGQPPIEPRPEVTIPELEKMFKLEQEGITSTPNVKMIYDELAGDKAAQKLMIRLKAQGLKDNEIIADMVRRGGFVSDETLNMLRNEYKLPIEATGQQVADALAIVLQNTATSHGNGLKAWDLAMRQRLDEAYIAAKNTADPEALKQLYRMQEVIKAIEKNPNGSLLRKAETISRSISGGTQLLRDVEKVWMSSLLAQPATASRNLLSQMGILGSQILGHVASGTVEAVAGKVAGDGLGFATYYGDLLSDFGAVASALVPGGKVAAKFGYTGAAPVVRRSLLDSIINNIPRLGTIETGASYTSQYNVIRDMFKIYHRTKKAGGTIKEALGNAKSLADEAGWIDVYTDGLTMMNRMQETTLRKIFFDSQLKSNLEAIGYKGGYEGLLEWIKEPGKLDPEYRAAIADAYEHSMKQTLAHTPEGLVPKAILKAINSVPLVGKVLLTPFPRFMMNQFRFMMERSPAGWFDLFSPEIREALKDGATNGFARRKASRALGQATEGMMLMSAAWIHRQGNQGEGYKYYEHRTNFKDEEGREVIMDLRNYQPFVSYAAMAHLIDATQKGKSYVDMPYTPNEWTDMAIGIRRLTETGIFALEPIIRAVTSGDGREIQRALGTPAGQFISSFFTPLRTLKDLSTIASPENSEQADIEYQELTGPARSNFPKELLPSQMQLPGRIDYTTGNTVQGYLPWLRQITGLTERGVSPLQRMVMTTPGVSERELVGEYGSREANQLVAKAMGTLLSTPVEKDLTLGDFYSNTVSSVKLSPELRIMLIKGFFQVVRDASKGFAQSVRPELFLADKQVAAAPAPMKETVRELADILLGILRTSGASPQPKD